VNYFYKYKKSLLTGFLIGLAVIAVLFLAADIKGVVDIFSNMNLKILPLILIMAPLNYIFRFLKWNYYLKVLGIMPEPKINRYIFMSGLSMTITPGKAGELLKCFLLKEHIGTPVSLSSPAVMAERITDGMAMVILASFGSLAYPYGGMVILISFCIISFLMIFFHIEPLFNFLTIKFAKIHLFKKSSVFLTNFQQNAKKLFSFSNLLLAVAIGVISWGFEGLVVYLAIRALGGEISILGSFFIVSVSSLLGALSFLPGGLGVTEGSIMATMILIGIGKEMAAAATVITRFSTLWLGIAIGIAGLILVQVKLEAGSKKAA